MFRSIFVQAVLGFGLIQGAWLTSACSSEPSVAEAQGTGKLSMPLLASAGAHQYRLQGSMIVSGPNSVWLNLDADASVLTAELPTGSYSAYLYTWVLTRDDGTGRFVPVSATLTSSSAPYFSIFNQTTTTVSFQFATDGQIVTVGAGQLNVAIEVTETPAVCTPLGEGCPSNSWCAPTELTGAPLSCIPAGPIAPGGACAGPSECGADSSCFDFGDGAVCLRLCSAAEFNQPCSSSGLCKPRGTDYGVCEPGADSGGAGGEAGAAGAGSSPGGGGGI
jgi:hypothetical protein